LVLTFSGADIGYFPFHHDGYKAEGGKTALTFMTKEKRGGGGGGPYLELSNKEKKGGKNRSLSSWGQPLVRWDILLYPNRTKKGEKRRRRKEHI